MCMSLNINLYELVTIFIFLVYAAHEVRTRAQKSECFEMQLFNLYSTVQFVRVDKGPYNSPVGELYPIPFI